MKSIKKQMSFDGCKFWLDGVCIGYVRPEHKFKMLDKATIQEYKQEYLDVIIDAERW